MKDKKYCPNCNGEFTKKQGTMPHAIFDKEIDVRNVPYYHCERCGEEEYVNPHKVDILIRDAYRNNLSEVEYT